MAIHGKLRQEKEELKKRIGDGRTRASAEAAENRRTDRSSIQQTELAHLDPPSPKQKARFMNLAGILRWMTMMVWLLKTPEAKARQGIGDKRLQQKLGWVPE